MWRLSPCSFGVILLLLQLKAATKGKKVISKWLAFIKSVFDALYSSGKILCSQICYLLWPYVLVILSLLFTWWNCSAFWYTKKNAEWLLKCILNTSNCYLFHLIQLLMFYIFRFQCFQRWIVGVVTIISPWWRMTINYLNTSQFWRS